MVRAGCGFAIGVMVRAVAGGVAGIGGVVVRAVAGGVTAVGGVVVRAAAGGVTVRAMPTAAVPRAGVAVGGVMVRATGETVRCGPVVEAVPPGRTVVIVLARAFLTTKSWASRSAKKTSLAKRCTLASHRANLTGWYCLVSAKNAVRASAAPPLGASPNASRGSANNRFCMVSRKSWASPSRTNRS
jgi:hypothetical protein